MDLFETVKSFLNIWPGDFRIGLWFGTKKYCRQTEVVTTCALLFIACECRIGCLSTWYFSVSRRFAGLWSSAWSTSRPLRSQTRQAALSSNGSFHADYESLEYFPGAIPRYLPIPVGCLHPPLCNQYKIQNLNKDAIFQEQDSFCKMCFKWISSLPYLGGIYI